MIRRVLRAAFDFALAVVDVALVFDGARRARLAQLERDRVAAEAERAAVDHDDPGADVDEPSLHVPQGAQSGVAAFFGRWPEEELVEQDETDLVAVRAARFWAAAEEIHRREEAAMVGDGDGDGDGDDRDDDDDGYDHSASLAWKAAQRSNGVPPSAGRIVCDREGCTSCLAIYGDVAGVDVKYAERQAEALGWRVTPGSARNYHHCPRCAA